MKRSGFTLIELLVVIAIVTLLLGILLPTLGMATRSVRRGACLNHLRQLTSSTMVYVQDSEGQFPFGFYVDEAGADNGLSVTMLPYYGHESLLLCPSDETAINQRQEMIWVLGWFAWPLPPDYRSYQYNTWLCRNRWMPQNKNVAAGRRDELQNESELILFYDGAIAPTSTPVYAWEIIQGRHEGGVFNAAFMDGHVQGFATELAGTYAAPDTWDLRFGPISKYEVADEVRQGLSIYHAGSDPYPETPQVYHPGQEEHGRSRPGFGAAVYGPAGAR
jgi:prepilin-type N-terminal cleavage/methylation domain-containing protein/prepilin-type processing-associated H-X9-DG protein